MKSKKEPAASNRLLRQPMQIGFLAMTDSQTPARHASQLAGVAGRSPCTLPSAEGKKIKKPTISGW